MILISIATSFVDIFCKITISVAILCSGYDAHLILSAVKPRHGKITFIPNNMERYTSFRINDVTFVDSCQFMLSSLEKLSGNLSNDQFREAREYLERFYIQSSNQPQINNVIERLKPCTSMKTIETTLINHQHSHQISNNKLKKT